MTPITEANARQLAIDARRDELLTVKEFAAIARIHEKTVRRRIRRGSQLGAVRVCGEWRIDITIALRFEPPAQPQLAPIV